MPKMITGNINNSKTPFAVAYICGGCGNYVAVEKIEDRNDLVFPDTWFSSTTDDPLAKRHESYDQMQSHLVTCSSDCIAAAKEGQKIYWKKWAERQAEVIENAKMTRKNGS